MLITMKNAVKNYGDFVLDCSLELLPGRVTGLIGRNGAGKTTAMSAILGLVRTDGGEVRVFGKDPMELMPAERRRIGVTLSEGGFSEWLTPKNVASIEAALYPELDKDAFLRSCEKNGLPADKQIRAYSKGMKAKFRLLCAMEHGADLLILDEPTAGLDVLARDEVLDLLRVYMEQKEDRGILISSHISSDLESLCDDLYLIENGRILLHEETHVLLGSYGLLKMPAERYGALDGRHILRVKKEPYGLCCLTDCRAFYADNYPDLTIEPGSIDSVMTMLLRGEAK